MRLAMSCSPLPLSFSSSAVAQTHYRNLSPAAILPQVGQWQPSGAGETGSCFPTKPKTIRFRLSQLCKEGSLHLAHELFDTIPQPTTVLWNALIIGYICNNMPHEAMALYSRMLSTSFTSQKCDAYTYSSVLKACAETKQLLIGKCLHCHILRSNLYQSRIVYNSLLNMYASCLLSSGFDLVERVFRSMRKKNVVSWNIMIAWYEKTGQLGNALVHFIMMVKMGFRPTVVSFVNVFPAVSGLRDIEFASSIYGLVIKMGDEYVNDLFIVSSAISMFSDLGCVDLARKIFDNCSKKNAHVWNTMIGGYVQNNFPTFALELFHKALVVEDGIEIDEVSFLLAITAASQLQNLDVALELHARVIKNELASSVVLLNAIISLYSRCASISDSFKVFSGMQERDIVSWNTMISALVQNGLDDEAIMLVLEMQKQDVSIDDVTITALFSAASNLRDLNIGKQTHAYLIRHGIHFNGMESYLIDMYAKSGMVKIAEKIFDRNCKCSSDQAIWNSMISGCTQNGLIEQAFITFEQMVKENVMPNAVTLASILPACSQSGNITLGKILHAFTIRNFVEANVFVNSALVDMYSKSGAVAYAERVFEKLPHKNSVTYTNMILGYGLNGMAEKSIKLFYSMRELGIKPDAVTFVAVLSACSYRGLIDEGLEIFEAMPSYGLKPLPEHYACIVDMLGRVGRLNEAYNFAQKLGKEGNVFGIWGSLLAACRIHQEFDLGKVVANVLLQMEGKEGITGYRVLLSNIHAEEGNWEDVRSLRKEMIEKGLTKEVACSWIDVSGYSNCFVSRDRKHPQCDQIYQLLKHLAANMKDAGFCPPILSTEL